MLILLQNLVKKTRCATRITGLPFKDTSPANARPCSKSANFTPGTM